MSLTFWVCFKQVNVVHFQFVVAQSSACHGFPSLRKNNLSYFDGAFEKNHTLFKPIPSIANSEIWSVSNRYTANTNKSLRCDWPALFHSCSYMGFSQNSQRTQREHRHTQDEHSFTQKGPKFAIHPSLQRLSSFSDYVTALHVPQYSSTLKI